MLAELKSPAYRLFVQQLYQAKNKENTAAPYYWPFARQTTCGHRWIPYTKGQKDS